MELDELFTCLVVLYKWRDGTCPTQDPCVRYEWRWTLRVCAVECLVPCVAWCGAVRHMLISGSFTRRGAGHIRAHCPLFVSGPSRWAEAGFGLPASGLCCIDGAVRVGCIDGAVRVV